MKISLGRKVTLGFTTAVLMLTVIGIVAYSCIQHFVVNSRLDDRSREVLMQILTLSSTMKDVETGTRGYVISGEEAYLEPYNSATAAIDPILSNLREITAGNSQQQKFLDQLEPLLREKIAASAETVQARHNGQLDVARQRVLSGEGKRLMDEARKILASMTGEETNLLRQRSTAEESSARRTITAMSCGIGLAFGLVALGGWMIRRDIAARLRAESALRESEERFRLVVDSAKEYAILMLDSEGHIKTWNAGAQRIKGYRAEEIVGQHFSRFYPPEEVDRGKPQQELRLALEQGQYTEEGWRVRKNGSRFWASVLVTSLRDSVGNHMGFSKITRDLTDRKHAEDAIAELNLTLQRGNAQLEAANKELEAFSYSVSHDLRAPLRSIDGFSQALLEDYAEKLDQDGKDSLQRVRAATQRMGQLIDDILNLSRVTRSEMRHDSVDLSAMANAVVADLRKIQPARSINISVAEGLRVQGDARLLRIVLDNLIGNAWKFTGRTSAACIEFGVSPEGAFFVRDNGAGFDMAYAEKLFGAFQRLHSMKEFAGTGIGLATVQRIIHRHGGRAWAEGAVDKGATFYFTVGADALRLEAA